MKLLSALALSAFAQLAYGGGWFVLSLGDPSAHAHPEAKASAFVVRVYGCAADAATVQATAEGTLNGERRSLPLELVPVGSDTPAGTPLGYKDFAVRAPSGDGDDWVVKVSATTGWATKTILVPLNGGRLVRSAARFNVKENR